MSDGQAAKAPVPAAVCAGVAAAGIVLLWGAIPLIVAFERRLPTELQWLGHAGFHLWTATIAGLLCAMAVQTLRARRLPVGLPGGLVTAGAGLAGVVTVANALEVVAAHPERRAFHDLVNAVGGPAGWALLAMLVVTAVGASAVHLRDGSGR